MVIAVDEKPIVSATTQVIGKVNIEVWNSNNQLTHCPPILLFHGMFSGGWYFESWAKFLCERGLVVYVVRDLHEGENLKKIDFSAYVEKSIKVVKLIHNITNSKIILLGHSMGGLIAQKIAEMKPNLIAGLILAASAPPRGISALSFGIVKSMTKHLFSILVNSPLRMDRKSAFELALSWKGDEERKEQIFKKLVPESSRIAKQLAFSKIPINERKIACKTLVVAGICDSFLSLDSQIAIAKKYNSNYRSFLNGHMLMCEDRQNKIISAIYEWISLNFIY